MERRDFLKLSILSSAAVLPIGIVNATEKLDYYDPSEFLGEGVRLYKLRTNKRFGFLSPNLGRTNRDNYSGKYPNYVDWYFPDYEKFLKYITELGIVKNIRPNLFKDPNTYTLLDNNGYVKSEWKTSERVLYDEKSRTLTLFLRLTNRILPEWEDSRNYYLNNTFKVFFEVDEKIETMINVKFSTI